MPTHNGCRIPLPSHVIVHYLDNYHLCNQFLEAGHSQFQFMVITGILVHIFLCYPFMIL